MKFGIVFGGNSFEHEISIVSAIAVKKVLKADLSFIFVDAFRDFYLIDPSDMRANFFSSGKYKNSKKLHLGKGGFAVHKLFGVTLLDVECYINLIHGSDGEDGKIAGMFEFFGLNFIGPRLESSVMSFNKELNKLLSVKCGVAMLPYETIKRGDKPQINLPFILKPARLGSSIGVSVVRETKELDYALDVAFEFDKDVLVEPFMEGIREFNLAGFKVGDEFEFSIIEEPQKKDFLDFEQKYMSFSARSSEEAKIDEGIKTELKKAFMAIYNGGAFDGALIRCDFFVLDNKVYLNEINPNPGSMANYLFKDFTSSATRLANSLKIPKNIKIDYKFINSITSNKGKI